MGRAVSAQLKKGDPAVLLPLALCCSRFGQALCQVSAVSEGNADSLAQYLKNEQRVSCKRFIFEDVHDDDTQLSTHKVLCYHFTERFTDQDLVSRSQAEKM